MTSTTTLRSDHGHFVTAEDGGGPQGVVIAGRPAGLATANRAAAAEWEQIRVERQSDGVWALKSPGGYYLCAEGDGHGGVTGVAVFNRGTVGEWERWMAVDGGDRVALLSWDGRSYLVAEVDGSLRVRVPGTEHGAPGPWESFASPASWWVVPVHVDDPHPHPFAGQLTTLGESCYADNNGPRVDNAVYHGGDVFGLYCESFEPGKEGLRAVALDVLAKAKKAGYPQVRSWLCVNDTRDPANPWATLGAPLYVGWGLRATPQYLQRGIEWARIVRSFGLAWHAAPGGLDKMDAQQEGRLFEAIRDIVSGAGPECFSLIEACNEARDTCDRDGDNEPANLERLINIVRARHPQILYTLTAYTGTEDANELARFNAPGVTRFVYHHGYRAGFIHDKIRHRGTFLRDNGIHRLGWDGEGCGPFSDKDEPGNGLTSVSAQENGHRSDRQFDDESVAAIGAAMAIQHGVPSFMCSTGVKSHADPASFPGFWSLPRLLRLLPAYTHLGRLTHGGRSDAVIRAVTNAGGHLGRADQCLVTNPQTGAREIVAILYGDHNGATQGEQTYAFPVAGRVTGVIIHPGTGEQHQIDASGSLSVSMKWARVLAARVS